ncbi:MAG TPA: trypsin-like peptidase domain-containing protein [Ignavibacteria bacterium]
MKLTEQQIFEKYKDCILKIIAYDSNGEEICHGSAVALKNEKAIVTNYHNILESDNFKLFDDNDQFIEHTGIVAIDPEKDILILSVNNNVLKNFSEVRIMILENIKIADRILTISFQEDYGKIITDGIISGINKTVKSDFLKIGKLRKNLLLFTANISPGSSGGAIFNLNGELIGISTLTDNRGQNLNFAIPFKDIQELIINSKEDYRQQKNSYKINEYLYNYFKSLKNENFETAIEYVNLCLELNIYIPYFLSLKITVYYLNQDFKKALEFSEQGSKTFNEERDYFDWCRINMYYKLEEYSNALNITKLYTSDNSYDSEFYLVLGAIYNNLGKHNEAIKILKSIKGVNLKGWDYYINLADAYYKKGKIYKAVRILYDGLSYYPENSFIYYSLYNTYYWYTNSNTYKEKYIIKALEFINKAIYIVESQNEIYLDRKRYLDMLYEKVRLLTIFEKYDEALNLINYYIGFYPEKEVGYSARAEIKRSQKNYKEALEDYNKSINIDINSVAAYIGRAKIYIDLGDELNTKNNIEKALEFKFEDIELSYLIEDFYYFIADLYYKLNDLEKAKDFCQKGLSRNSIHKSTLFLLLIINIQLENIAEAKKCLAIIFKFYPYDKELFLDWGAVLIQNKSYDDAIKILSTVIDKFDNYADAYINRGIANLNKSRPKIAIQDFNKAIELSPQNISGYYYRGFATNNMELFQQAINDWEYVITLDCNYEKELLPLIKEASKNINPSISRRIMNYFKLI